jgi:hypothetical protein
MKTGTKIKVEALEICNGIQTVKEVEGEVIEDLADGSYKVQFIDGNQSYIATIQKKDLIDSNYDIFR